MRLLNDENYLDLIKDGIVIVDFFATWCGPCKMMKLVLEEVEKEIDVNIIQIDVDKHEDIARGYGVMSIPTLLFYKDGELINKKIGFVDKTTVLNMIKEM